MGKGIHGDLNKEIRLVDPVVKGIRVIYLFAEDVRRLVWRYGLLRCNGGGGYVGEGGNTQMRGFAWIFGYNYLHNACIG